MHVPLRSYSGGIPTSSAPSLPYRVSYTTRRQCAGNAPNLSFFPPLLDYDTLSISRVQMKGTIDIQGKPSLKTLPIPMILEQTVLI